MERPFSPKCVDLVKMPSSQMTWLKVVVEALLAASESVVSSLDRNAPTVESPAVVSPRVKVWLDKCPPADK